MEKQLLFQAGLLDQIRNAVIATDPQGRIVYWNRFAEALYQWSAGHALGKNILEFTSGGSNPRLYNAILAEVENTGRWNGELAVQRKDGTVFSSRLMLTSLRDGQGRVSGFVAVSEDVTVSEQQLRDTLQHMEKMSRRLVEVQEEERRHLARELHDEVGQSLTVLSINLKTLEEETAAHPLPQLAESIRIVEHLIEQVRQLSIDLRPAMLDILGLAAALRWYIDRQARASGIQIDFTHALSGQRLSPTLETACFRVVQEALTNIVRHAHTQRVQIEISRQGGEVHLVIQDEGVGFDVTTARQRVLQGGSFGLLSMEERVHLLQGHIDIHSAVGQGTTIRVRFPEPGNPAPACPGQGATP